jgi:hypothetical protein
MGTEMLNDGVPKVWQQRAVFGRICMLHKTLDLRGRQWPLGQEESRQVLELTELYAFREEWVRVVEIASRATALGCARASQPALYRIWIRALKELGDTAALGNLASHFLVRRSESQAFAALALLALTYAGRSWTARAVFNQLARLESSDALVLECLSLYRRENPLADLPTPEVSETIKTTHNGDETEKSQCKTDCLKMSQGNRTACLPQPLHRTFREFADVARASHEAVPDFSLAARAPPIAPESVPIAKRACTTERKGH